jgi:hypothetical protein
MAAGQPLAKGQGAPLPLSRGGAARLACGAVGLLYNRAVERVTTPLKNPSFPGFF